MINLDFYEITTQILIVLPPITSLNLFDSGNNFISLHGRIDLQIE